MKYSDDLAGDLRELHELLKRDDENRRDFKGRLDAHEESINEIHKRLQRPGPEAIPDNLSTEEARQWCVQKHFLAAAW